MTRKLTIILLLLAVVAASASSAKSETEVYTGTVVMENVQARAGESFQVRAWLNGNDEDLSGIFLPIVFDHPHVTFDSISIGGTVWQGDFSTAKSYDGFLDVHRLFVLPELSDPMPTATFTSGLVLRLWFTASPMTPPQVIPVDTLYHDTVLAGGVQVFTRLEVADSSGMLYLPGYIPGSIEILAPTDVNDGGDLAALPNDYVLGQNYPNPFNPSTVIEFGLPTTGRVQLDVYNILGQNVLTLLDRELPAGVHSLEFDASGMPSGIYFYRLSHAEGSLTRKMVLVK